MPKPRRKGVPHALTCDGCSMRLFICSRCLNVFQTTVVEISGQPIEEWFEERGQQCTDCATRKRVLLYPGMDLPGRTHATPMDTEVAAALSITSISGAQRLTVLREIWQAGDEGRIDQENELNVPGLSRSSASTRRFELMEMGWVEDSGRRRRTTTGRLAAVWVLTREAREQIHRLYFPEPEVAAA